MNRLQISLSNNGFVNFNSFQFRQTISDVLNNYRQIQKGKLMKDFINILTHARRLNAATKSLTASELKDVAEKLEGVIEKRTQEEIEELKEQQKKRAQIEEIRKKMEEAGLSAEDLLESSPTAAKPRKKRTPLPPKYEYTDENGERQTWTGQGRAPKPIQKALNSGGSKEQFLIK